MGNGKYAQRKGYGLLLTLLLISALPSYIAWVCLAGAFILYVLCNLRCFSLPKMPGGICYWALFLILVAVGAVYFNPAERGYWPYLRDIIDFTSLFLYWFAASEIIRTNQYDTKTVYRIIVLYSVILSVGGLLQRVSGYQGASEDFSSFVASGGVSQFTLAIGLYLSLFKPPVIEKYYFSRFFDLLADIVLLGTFALSFSRTTVMIFLCLIIMGQYDRMSAMIKCILLGIVGLIAVSYLLPNVWTSFMDKIMNSVTEISASNTWSNYNIVNNWRGFEVYSAKKAFSQYSIFAQVFGKGFGATVDVGHYAYLVTSETALPYLHNGYYTTLIKGGILGIVLTIGYFGANILYVRERVSFKYEKRLAIGLIISMILTMSVIHGIFWGGPQLTAFVLLVQMEKGITRDELMMIQGENNDFCGNGNI